MGLVDWVRSLLEARSTTEDKTVEADSFFVYVMIPESLGPIERGVRYEDPIEAQLLVSGLGEITGGGSQLGDADSNGVRPIEFCGIDVEITVLEDGLAILRSQLTELEAPFGTELHYEMAGVKLQDVFSSDGWSLRRPRFIYGPRTTEATRERVPHLSTSRFVHLNGPASKP